MKDSAVNSPAGDDPKVRRTNRMINPQFQKGLVMRLGGLTLFYFLFCLFISIALPMGLAAVGASREDALAEVAFRIEVLFKVLLAPLAVTFLALWVHGLQETFRIAGPNYRFKTVMGQLQDLVIPRGVRVRDDDYLQDTADEFHDALIKLHDEVDALKSKAARAVEAVHGTGPQCSREQHELAVDAVEQVSSALERIQLVGCAPACKPLTSEAMEEPADSESFAEVDSELSER